MLKSSVPRSSRTSPKRRRYALLLLLGGAAILGLGIAVALNWSKIPTDGASPDDPEQVSLGRTVYAANCASCHGVRLEGQPNWRIRKPDGKLPAPPHDETGHTWHHPDQQLFKITGSGVAAIVPGYESDMPAYQDVLSDEEIWAVLAFIKSTWRPEILRRQDRRSQGAEQ